MLFQISDYQPIGYAVLATMFTYGVTVACAALVFFFKTINKKALNLMLGFAAGVMIAASFWSLLAPAISLAEDAVVPGWMPALVGFGCGGVFLWLIDQTMPHLHRDQPIGRAEGIKTSWQRSLLLVIAITIHNIPEGLAVGVAFGAVAAGVPEATLGSAIAVALGIGIQNFPEGAAVSVPLRREGLSLGKSFFYGQISGVVEPIAGIFGAFVVIFVRPILPYALAFAAGAMIYVVAEELLPEPAREGSTDIATIGVMILSLDRKT